MQQVKQSTESVIYVYLADATDGYTPETGVTSPTVYLTKNGGTPAVPSSLAFAELDSTNMPGWYKITLSTTDTNTLGPLGIDCYKSGTSRHFPLAVDVVANVVADVKSDSAAILADTGTDGVVIATATQDAITDKVWDEAISGHLSTGTTGAKLNAATAAADPWSVELPGAYTGNEAGYKIGRLLSGLGAALYTLTVQDADDNPIEGVTVDFHTSATPSDAAFYTRDETNTSGQATVYLPTGTYYAFRFKRGYAFTDPLTVTVT